MVLVVVVVVVAAAAAALAALAASAMAMTMVRWWLSIKLFPPETRSVHSDRTACVRGDDDVQPIDLSVSSRFVVTRFGAVTIYLITSLFTPPLFTLFVS